MFNNQKLILNQMDNEFEVFWAGLFLTTLHYCLGPENITCTWHFLVLCALMPHSVSRAAA